MKTRPELLIERSINKLNSISKGISLTHDIDTLKRRISYESKNIILYLNEILHTSYIDKYCCLGNAIELFTSKMNSVMNSNNINELKDNLINLINSISIDSIEDYISKNRRSFGFINRVEMDNNVMNILFNSIKSIRKVNLLDSISNKGENAIKFKEGFSFETEIYGMEENGYLADVSKSTGVFHRVAKGGLSNSICSTLAFDIISNIAQYDSIAEFFPNTKSLKQTAEQANFRKLTSNLNYDGIMIYTMLKYRLESTMCSFVAKNYKDVYVLENETRPCVVTIVAKRKVFNEVADENIYRKLREITQNNYKCDKEIDKEFLIEGVQPEVKIFRGGILDENDIEEIVGETNLLNEFFTQYNNDHDASTNNNKRPLLPFNLGQIGLVLTSGCLDGVIEELPGQYHVIKGDVTKETVTIEERTKEGTQITETHLNKVNIKILTPDGSIKTLT